MPTCNTVYNTAMKFIISIDFVSRNSCLHLLGYVLRGYSSVFVLQWKIKLSCVPNLWVSEELLSASVFAAILS